ncbi:MAG: hypothetical protein PHV74_04380 [Dehalococcoidia bacterium]|nr:hypothetical protein [Dehalococcoidia bacterium]
MELGVILVLVFGAVAAVWFYRLNTRSNDTHRYIAPLIVLRKEELMNNYLQKGVLPNSVVSHRKQYLIDKLEADTIGYLEARELIKVLKMEEAEARRTANEDALVAILGLAALLAMVAGLSTR